MARYKKRIEISKDIDVIFSLPLFTGDIGNSVELEFYLHGNPYEFTTATLYGTNKSGKTVYSNAYAKENTVTLPILNEMYQAAGKETDCQVVLSDESGNSLTSAYLHFTVLQGLSENAKIEGSDEYNALMELISQISSSMAQINRAEEAANEIESFLKLIAKPENSVVHQISESEVDIFSEGYAIVSSSVTTDSDDGPILSDYKYPLIAESV
ncbi:MAG: hypothetical protein E7399_01470, partial [Ruminococcaceae bacterium]|nr:hypothetical protein [Oscillospiraceae bacterium]